MNAFVYEEPNDINTIYCLLFMQGQNNQTAIRSLILQPRYEAGSNLVKPLPPVV
jgi:hypothetical protein